MKTQTKTVVLTGVMIVAFTSISWQTAKKSVDDSLDSLEQLHSTWHQQWQDLAEAPKPEPEPCFDTGLQFRNEPCPHPDHRIMSTSSAFKGVAFFCVCPRQDPSLYPSVPDKNPDTPE